MSLQLLSDLATCKAWLNIATLDTDDDAQITQLISAISAQAAIYCNRNFGVNTYTETYNGLGNLTQWLNQRPVVSVSSVTIDGVNVPARPNALSSGFVADRNEVYLYGWYFTTGFQNVVVTYDAGISCSAANTPDLWQAVTEWIALVFQSQKRVGLKSESLNGQNTSYMVADLPESITLVLNRYEQVSPVQSIADL